MTKAFSTLLKKMSPAAQERAKEHTRLLLVEDAAQTVVDAYVSRFEAGRGRIYGPIDDEILALRKRLRENT